MIQQRAWDVEYLDATDWAILGHLQRDGRLYNKELAERVGFSQSTCSARVKRLEDAGIITGYQANVDCSKLGAGFSARAVIEVDGASWDTLNAFKAHLAASTLIASAEQSARPHIFTLHVVGDSFEAWGAFLAAAAEAGFALSVPHFDMVMERVKAPSSAPHIRRVA